MDWAVSMARVEGRWKDSPRKPWSQGVAHFSAALKASDDYLAPVAMGRAGPNQSSPVREFG